MNLLHHDSGLHGVLCILNRANMCSCCMLVQHSVQQSMNGMEQRMCNDIGLYIGFGEVCYATPEFGFIPYLLPYTARDHYVKCERQIGVCAVPQRSSLLSMTVRHEGAQHVYTSSTLLCHLRRLINMLSGSRRSPQYIRCQCSWCHQSQPSSLVCN